LGFFFSPIQIKVARRELLLTTTTQQRQATQAQQC
jgi:hypothetical protein